MSAQLRLLLRTGTTALLLAACGCGVLWKGIGPDPSFARPTDRWFQTVAVIPFNGDAAARRSAEEVAALGLREQARVAIVPPFRVTRILDAALASGSLDAGWRATIDAWLLAAEGRPSAGAVDATALFRSLGTLLGADALVIGNVRRLDPSDFSRFARSESAVSNVVVVDGSTGAAMAHVRTVGFGLERARFGSTTTLGFNEAAAESVRRGADGVRAYLLHEPWTTPQDPKRRLPAAVPGWGQP
jgi:hypothetical protein